MKKIIKTIKKLSRAITKPKEVFSDLDDEFSFLLILALFPIRMLHTQLHVYLVHNEFYQANYAGFLDLLLAFKWLRGLQYIGYFLIVSVVIYVIARKLGSDINYKGVEEAVFLIMVTPLILTFLDLPHLFIESSYLWNTCFHISLPILLVVMPLQISYLLKEAWNIDRKFTLLPSLLIPLRFKWLSPFLTRSGFKPPWLPQQVAVLLLGFYLACFYAKRRNWTRLALVLTLLPYGIYLFLQS